VQWKVCSAQRPEFRSVEARGYPALFYTGLYADVTREPFQGLDLTSGKVPVGGDGNRRILFSSKPDIPYDTFRMF